MGHDAIWTFTLRWLHPKLWPVAIRQPHLQQHITTLCRWSSRGPHLGMLILGESLGSLSARCCRLMAALPSRHNCPDQVHVPAERWCQTYSQQYP